MASRHTPGPWKLSAGYHKTASGEPADWTIEGGPNGCAIAFLSDDNAGPRYERDANARLIAAAPDLLALLRRYVGRAEQLNETNNDLHRETVSALAKAEAKP